MTLWNRSWWPDKKEGQWATARAGGSKEEDEKTLEQSDTMKVIFSLTDQDYNLVIYTAVYNNHIPIK